MKIFPKAALSPILIMRNGVMIFINHFNLTILKRKYF